MPALEPKLDGANVTLLGSFNPLIFQPAWFAAQGLLRQQETDAAQVELVHPDFVSFGVDWLKLSITRERFTAFTLQQHSYEPLRDLVVETFKLLSHTPITGMGINWDGHFQLANEDAWHALGHRLAPKQEWKEILKSPGMVTLVMRGERPDAHSGSVVVKVEASTTVRPNGVYVSVNDHFDGSPDAEGKSGCSKLMAILESTWSASVSRSKAIAGKLTESR